jgi:signal peptidase I
MLKIRSWIQSELPQILLIIVLILAARSSLADHYYVPSGSMEYTLMPGDRVLVSKLAYGLRVPFTSIEFGSGTAVERGDVVIFDSPKDGTRLIKRIVGIGGDTLSIDAGRLTINGVALATGSGDSEMFGERIAALNLQDGGGPDLENASIPPHMLLAVGDHRGSSLDGRYFGLVDEDDVYGKALGVYRRRGEGFLWNPL